MSHKVINWEPIERDFIGGILTNNVHRYPSMNELATKYGLHHSSVSRHAKLHGWVNARNRLRDQVLANWVEAEIARRSS